MEVFNKDPNSTKVYYAPWSSFLDGKSIESSEWLVSPEGLTIGVNDYASTTARVSISGGDLGKKYRLTNRITYTDNGLPVSEDRSGNIFIMHR